MPWSELVRRYRVHDDRRNLRPRYNIAPTQDVDRLPISGPVGVRESGRFQSMAA
jgi:hypothetical protein